MLQFNHFTDRKNTPFLSSLQSYIAEHETKLVEDFTHLYPRVGFDASGRHNVLILG